MFYKIEDSADLEQIRQLTVQARYDEALTCSKDGENRQSDDSMRLRYLLMQGYIYIYKLDHEKAQTILEQVIKESSQRNLPFILLDALILKTDDLSYSLKIKDVHKLLEEIEDKLRVNIEIYPREVLKRQAPVFRLKGTLLLNEGNYSNALEFYQRSLSLFKENGNNHEARHTLNSIGNCYRDLGEKDNAMNTYQEAIDLAEAIGDIHGYAVVSSNIVNLKLAEGNFEKAMELSKKCLEIYTDLGLQKRQSSVLMTIGFISRMKGEYNQAEKYYNQALRISETINDPAGLIYSYNCLYYLYMEELKDPDRGFEYLQRAVSAAEKLDNEQFRGFSHLWSGYYYLHLGNFDQAIDYFNQSLQIMKALKIETLLIHPLSALSQAYLYIGELDKAQNYLKLAIPICEHTGANQELAYALKVMGLIYHTKKDFQKASEYYKKCKALYEKFYEAEKSSVLFSLLKLSLDDRNLIEANVYLEDLESLSQKWKLEFVKQYHLVAKALFLKHSDRLMDKFEAQKILLEVVNNRPFRIETTIDAIFHLCDLLLYELKTTGNSKVLEEVKTLSERLFVIGEQQQSFSILAQAYLVKSKIKFLELNLQESLLLLNQAEEITLEKKLGRLRTLIKSERDLLLSQIDKWEILIEKQPTSQEIIELSNFENLLETFVQERLIYKQEKTFDYLGRAKKMIDFWKEVHPSS
jgi:tetratricopeptide (TPR) repeat protein